ncbi:MAG TPA: PAS domain S-box protein [Casimicrobiaceae bacterium]
MKDRIVSLKHDANIALQRFAELRQQSRNADGNPRLVDEVLEELSVALHELEVGSDELREQNERLLRAENRLSEERRRYQELFEFGPDGYLVTTATAMIREANHMAATLLGVSTANLFGKPLSVFVHIDQRPAFRTLINSMAAGEMTTHTLETSMVRRGGEQFPAVLRVTAARSPRTANVELRWTLRDVSTERTVQRALVAEIEERKRAEESLRRSEARYRHLVEHATDIVYELDGKGRFTFCNDRATQRILGYTERELLGRRLLDLVPRAHQKAVSAFAKRQLQHPGQENYFEFPVLAKDQRTIWLGQHVSPMLHGKELRIQAICRDISAQVDRVAQLTQTGEQWRDLSAHLQTQIEAERARIAQDIHDELGAALTAIRMELALPSTPDEGDAKQPRRRNVAAIRRIDAAIEAMRRICSDLRPSLLDNMGLCAAIEWLAQDVQERAGIRCEVLLQGFDKEPEPNKGTAIFRIVQEAVTNAIRHSGASKLRISQRVNGSAAILSIADDGRGIKSEELAGRKSFGIVGMKERAQSFGGKVTISGGRQGTQVTVRIPTR